MDSEKFRDLLIRVSNVKLEKPSQIAKMNNLQAQAQQLKIRCKDMIEKIQKCCSATEDLGNKKTSQLIDVETKNRDKWNMFRKQMIKEKQTNQAAVNHGLGIARQLQQIMNAKSKSLYRQLQQRNSAYLEMLNIQLQAIKTLRNSSLSKKKIRQQNYQIWLATCMKKANKLIQSQQADLKIIQQFQIQMMNKCDEIETQYLLKLEDQKQLGNQRQKMLFRKLQTLIGDIDID